ncbi:uncharacterized protein Z518_02364 [Rhinocladiella mackenziei CBS 650.93]|uniref:Uncharacterized protein n=1 Tax=Rhinocladiella mackenziei CBS 650.93 TaxID=1442369 RepID=A0A0D2JET1_9EURO|nr:uncharacterized protein Z518_02364 [Rhinocladiella mackenziei CBS 650.93]KIX07710.1 hypothetical protein Z518_02364 [Rhinocladiella mackenziei CBS 650.93]
MDAKIEIDTHIQHILLLAGVHVGKILDSGKYFELLEHFRRAHVGFWGQVVRLSVNFYIGLVTNRQVCAVIVDGSEAVFVLIRDSMTSGSFYHAPLHEPAKFGWTIARDGPSCKALFSRVATMRSFTSRALSSDNSDSITAVPFTVAAAIFLLNPVSRCRTAGEHRRHLAPHHAACLFAALVN